MPCSVYWPLRHMSHSPVAQLAHGTGSGAARSPRSSRRARPATWRRLHHLRRATRVRAPAAFVRRRRAELALDDVDVRAAHAERDGPRHQPALRWRRVRDVLERRRSRRPGSTVTARIATGGAGGAVSTCLPTRRRCPRARGRRGGDGLERADPALQLRRCGFQAAMRPASARVSKSFILSRWRCADRCAARASRTPRGARRFLPTQMTSANSTARKSLCHGAPAAPHTLAA
jgi:hypothetical protein